MAWQLSGTYYAPCSCKVGCPCLLGETEADQGWCSGMIVLDIRSGQVDGVDVSGSKVALLADWPGGFLLGDGKGRVHFDPSVSPDKRERLGPVLSGKMGGVFEAIGGLVPTIETGADAAISMQSQGEETKLTIGDFAELNITPLKGPSGDTTKVLHGAAAFREETFLGRSAGSVRPPGMRSWQNERGHAEWDDFDWSAQGFQRPILTPEEVADYLQIRKDTVYRYIRAGKLAAVRLGRYYRVPRENLDLFLLANSTRADVREALFKRVLAVAEKSPEIPIEEVERDVAEAVAAARRPGRG